MDVHLSDKVSEMISTLARETGLSPVKIIRLAIEDFYHRYRKGELRFLTEKDDERVSPSMLAASRERRAGERL